MSSSATVAVLQMCSGPDVSANLSVADGLMAQAASAGAGLALLPENFAFMGRQEPDKLQVAEAEGAGPVQDFLAQSARRHGLWVVAGSVFLEAPGDPERVLAACLVYDAQGQRMARYDKMHLFDVAVAGEGGAERYRESATIAHGADRTVVVPTPAGLAGLSVCYDLRFPEFYRRLGAAGAELLLVPSAFTARTGAAHWEPLLRARAIENQCYVLAANQAGTHTGGRQTWGHSGIMDPWGRVLCMLDQAEVGIAVAEVDLKGLAALRSEFPVLTHRRV